MSKISSGALDFTVHWMWSAIEFAVTYLWPLLILGAAVVAWRALKRL